MQFVIDESGWKLDGQPPQNVERALERFLDRLSVARERNERVLINEWFYEFEVLQGTRILELLFEETNLGLDPDLRMRLYVALGGLPTWEEESQGQVLEVGTNEGTIFAPSIAFAHECVLRKIATGCFPLETAARRGPVEIEVAGNTVPIHFVTDENGHRSFCRNAIDVENAGVNNFERFTSSAFPDLLWVDGIWRGLSTFSKPFRDLRLTVTNHLAVLDDHGARIFRENLATPPGQIGKMLSGLGAEASNENGRTKRIKRAERERTKPFSGIDRVFWWHTKLQHQCDRIHFLYDRDIDRIIVGIFTEHCYVPG